MTALDEVYNRIKELEHTNPIDIRKFVELICEYANARLLDDNINAFITLLENNSYYVFYAHVNGIKIKIKQLSKSFVKENIEATGIMYWFDGREEVYTGGQVYARNWITITGARLFRVVESKSYRYREENEYWK